MLSLLFLIMLISQLLSVLIYQYNPQFRLYVVFVQFPMYLYLGKYNWNAISHVYLYNKAQVCSI